MAVATADLFAVPAPSRVRQRADLVVQRSRPHRLPGYSAMILIDGHLVDRAALVPWVRAMPDALLLRELRVA